jgi:hypothetical protein
MNHISFLREHSPEREKRCFLGLTEDCRLT